MLGRRSRPGDPVRGESMKWSGKGRGGIVALLVAGGALLVGVVESAAASGDQWNSAGGNLQNTRFQAGEKALSASNVAGLTVKWQFTTGGDVSATPAVDADTVYFPDRAGNLYAVAKSTGQQRWRSGIAAASGVPGDYARATPAIASNKVIIGTQGPFGGGGKVRWRAVIVRPSAGRLGRERLRCQPLTHLFDFLRRWRRRRRRPDRAAAAQRNQQQQRHGCQAGEAT